MLEMTARVTTRLMTPTNEGDDGGDPDFTLSESGTAMLSLLPQGSVAVTVTLT